MALKVAVSPFFGGDNWTDAQTGVTFEKSKTGAMAIYDLSNIPVNQLDGVRKAIRLNALTLVEGSLDEAPKAEPVKEVKEEVKVDETPAVEVVVDETPAEEEDKQEVKKAPKRK